MSHSDGWDEIQNQLAAVFPVDKVRWRIGRTSGTRASALAYIDARDVMDRLDLVVGIGGWRDSIHDLGNSALCTLELWDGEKWIAKTDGAEESNIESTKGKFSNAFKRAANKWGVGRYLYGLDSPWVDTEKKGSQTVIAKHEMKRLQEYLTMKMEDDSTNFSEDSSNGGEVEYGDWDTPAPNRKDESSNGTERKREDSSIEPMSESQAKMLMAHCRTIGEDNGGAHGFEVLNWTLKSLMLEPVRQRGARAPVYMEHLIANVAKKEVDDFKEAATKFE